MKTRYCAARFFGPTRIVTPIAAPSGEDEAYQIDHFGSFLWISRSNAVLCQTPPNLASTRDRSVDISDPTCGFGTSSSFCYSASPWSSSFKELLEQPRPQGKGRGPVKMKYAMLMKFWLTSSVTGRMRIEASMTSRKKPLTIRSQWYNVWIATSPNSRSEEP
jgi:hypothetical protein